MKIKGAVAGPEVNQALLFCGLKPEDFYSKMMSAEIVEALHRDAELAASMDITGTPTFVTQKAVVRGYDIDKIISSSM